MRNVVSTKFFRGYSKFHSIRVFLRATRISSFFFCRSQIPVAKTSCVITRKKDCATLSAETRPLARKARKADLSRSTRTYRELRAKTELFPLPLQLRSAIYVRRKHSRCVRQIYELDRALVEKVENTWPLWRNASVFEFFELWEQLNWSTRHLKYERMKHFQKNLKHLSFKTLKYPF